MRWLWFGLSGALALMAVTGCQKKPAEEKPLPPPKIVKEIPLEASPLRKTYEAEELGKQLSKGEVTADPAASNQMSLYVKYGGAKHDEYIAWGPYEEIAPGKYVARWRLKAARLPANDKTVISLDVSGYPKADPNNYQMILCTNLTAKDFPDPTKYYVFDLTFEVTQPFIFELRTKYMQDCELWLDWSSLELVK